MNAKNFSLYPLNLLKLRDELQKNNYEWNTSFKDIGFKKFEDLAWNMYGVKYNESHFKELINYIDSIATGKENFLTKYMWNYNSTIAIILWKY